MKPAAFEYHRPARLTEALDMLASLPDAKLLAGGQSLGPMLNFRYLMPENLIDLNHVKELQGLSWLADDALRIGAMTRQFQLEQDETLYRRIPIFREALRWVGHYATRNRGTIGGSLSHLDPAAELPGICALLDAELGVQSVAGRRTISIHDWTVGFMQPNIGEDELLTDIVVRPWTQPHGFSFLEMSRRHGDFAIAGIACLLAVDAQSRIEKVAVSVIGVSNGATRLHQAEKALVGAVCTDGVIQAASQEIAQLQAPADAHHSGDFRKRTAKTLFCRAVQQAYRDAINRRSAQ